VKVHKQIKHPHTFSLCRQVCGKKNPIDKKKVASAPWRVLLVISELSSLNRTSTSRKMSCTVLFRLFGVVDVDGNVAFEHLSMQTDNPTQTQRKKNGEAESPPLLSLHCPSSFFVRLDRQ
jgi:hypothetical protein